MCDGVLCVVVCVVWWCVSVRGGARTCRCCVMCLFFSLSCFRFYLTLSSGRIEFGVGERSKKNEINGTNRTHKKHHKLGLKLFRTMATGRKTLEKQSL